MSPSRMPALAAGPPSATLMTITSPLFSAENTPSHGRGGLVDLAARHQVVEDRRQEVDRHHHVDVGDLAVAAICSRSEPMPMSLPSASISAAPPQDGCAGRDEDRLVEQIFPIAGELLLGDDGRADRLRPLPSAKTTGSPSLALLELAELERRQVELRRAPAPGRSRSPGRRPAHGRRRRARPGRSARLPRPR